MSDASSSTTWSYCHQDCYWHQTCARSARWKATCEEDACIINFIPLCETCQAVCPECHGRLQCQQEFPGYSNSSKYTFTTAACYGGGRKGRGRGRGHQARVWAWDAWYRVGSLSPTWHAHDCQHQPEWQRSVAEAANRTIGISINPGACRGWVGRNQENLNRLRQLPGVDAIDTHTNYADGQFQGRIPKEAFIVATATDGALERIVHEVEKAELRHEQGRGREPPGRKTLHLVLAHPVDQLKSLTFVKTNMQKCLCTFAPFPSRPYFEPCALQSGTSNRDSTVSRFHGRDSDRRRIRVGEDCTSVMDMIREVDPEDASREVSKVTVRLGCILFHGRDPRKTQGLLSLKDFQELRPSLDVLTQFSRHFHKTQDVAKKLFSVLGSEWKVRHWCRQMKLRFSLVDPESHPDLPKEVELTFGAFNPQLGQKLPPIRNLCEQKRPLLQSDVHFLSTGLGARLELRGEELREDLKQRFASACFHDKILHFAGESASYRLDRISRNQKIARHVAAS
ncbi:unnamed protein product [Durusdinium trenchii]|uniref:Uncharacterized protein n=1 Tax=Durusdinium trenchii TaxID=1381693 RepID=A0ABP0Q5D4_9DINO